MLALILEDSIYTNMEVEMLRVQLRRGFDYWTVLRFLQLTPVLSKLVQVSNIDAKTSLAEYIPVKNSAQCIY